jgi:hypothetical protein
LLKQILLIAGLSTAALLSTAGLDAATEKAKARGEKLPFEVHSGYFESNKSGLKGEASYLVFTDPKAFEKVFGIGVVMGKKPKLLPADAFDSHFVIAVIKRGKAVWEYQVAKVTEDQGKVYVEYTATSKEGGGSATFASLLIVSLPKGRYSSVVFIENRKNVATVALGK